MSGQIIFFRKSYADLSAVNVVATASQGQATADYARNRRNDSAWITTGSVDADATTFELDFVDEVPLTDILLVKHNFKSYTIQYWNGSAYADFSTPISETVNAAATKRHTFSSVDTSKIKLTVNGTMTANEDKYLYQFIATRLLGQLAGWPVIKNPKHGRNKLISKMLSGKEAVFESVGGFTCSLKVNHWRNADDLTLIESLYASYNGFLVWLGGGSETQFFRAHQGYRLEDVYLMKCRDDYEPELVSGLYQAGLDLDIKLTEAVN